MTDHETLRDLSDRAEITELLARGAQLLDERRFDRLGEVFTDDVVARTPAGEAEGLEALAGIAGSAHADYSGTFHSPANPIIDLDGDTARIRSVANVVFTLADGSVSLLTARYRHEARRTGDGWRFSLMDITPNTRTAPLAQAE
ncbi:nuclear transport factor 2 family protein [Glycomyces xiaoerkulensis]|uniref:nuclear transport factor 2 family protein n=1 Tax=Glycomyces xiaoerkulensis TaxID=2038139 RepID=UPI000C25B75D|nr:nuclear transport factor 2 family protein [Glycomyces xiaoerkulensis]